VLRSRVWYNDFEFHKVYRAVYDFATVDLSNVYFDVLKDRLYTAATKGKARRSAQTALYRLAHALVRLLAPILSFTCEEVWGHLREAGTVHTALFPEPSELTAGLHEHNRKQAANWDRLMEARVEVLKALEIKRNEKFIGAPLEARVRIAVGGEMLQFLQSYADELPGLLIVSQVGLEPAASEALQVTVERAAGVKCERCWKYTEDVGSDAELPTVCAACSLAIRENLNA
jgi:isoleucyl-tRNA synthetase